MSKLILHLLKEDLQKLINKHSSISVTAREALSMINHDVQSISNQEELDDKLFSYRNYVENLKRISRNK